MFFICFQNELRSGANDFEPRLAEAVTAFQQARYRDALDQYQRTLEEAQRGGAPAGVRGRIERGIGACWIALSDYQAALEVLARARADTVAGGSRDDLAAVEANIASAHLYQGDLETAQRIYRRALGLLSASPRSPHRWAILTSLAAVELRRKRYSQAIALLSPVVRAAQASGDRNLEAAASDLVGFGYLGLRDFDRARDSFSRSLELRGPDAVRSLTYLGMAELERGSPETALEILARSVPLAQRGDSPVNLWGALYWRGKSYWALRRWDPAIADLRSAVEVLQSIRSRVAPADALRVQYEVSHHKVYSALADLLCEREKAAEAFEAVELGRGQSLRALLETRLGEAPAAGLKQVQQQMLDGDSLLLNFYIGSESAYLWAVSSQEARFYRLPPAGEWSPEIRRFIRALEAGDPAARDAGRRLYRALLGQVAPELLERRHWIVAADGDLVLLPFCALPGAGGYLVERHSFNLVPSVSVLASLQDREATSYEYDFLGVADPVLNRADPRWGRAPPPAKNLPRLPRLISSGVEIQACARLFGMERSALLSGFDASASELRRRAQHSYRYWHFTSHIAAEPRRVDRLFIALSIPPGGGAMERFTVQDVMGLKVRAEMVLLNGCDSGTGPNLPGAGVVGLARAFLAAGARSVCATRWRIPDEQGALVEHLYRRLAGRPGVPVDRAEALRQAQREMIRAGDWRAEPRYWAAYFLMGSRSTPEGEHARRP